MDEHSAEKIIGKLLSELYRAHTAEPFITFETIDMILDGFSELDLDRQKAFSARMVKYLTTEYSEAEMILLSREIMADVLAKGKEIIYSSGTRDKLISIGNEPIGCCYDNENQ